MTPIPKTKILHIIFNILFKEYFIFVKKMKKKKKSEIDEDFSL